MIGIWERRRQVAPLDGVGDSVDSLVLAHNAAVQNVRQVQQLLALAGHQLAHLQSQHMGCQALHLRVQLLLALAGLGI